VPQTRMTRVNRASPRAVGFTERIQPNPDVDLTGA
jgi:hypothetical protein